ncbi:ferrous iron transporter B [Bacillus pseudomycoides]|uniref:nucleoside recognition domain-containing protein n=1 Tax=Bacillus TaxID=1386 RepID=UPI0003767687|nr:MULTISPECIES: nucleoside recognition domain-containing protein [Bacillus]MCX2828877.1 ferrous iron transporter B [Bacillus sp. DHT2]MDR4916915.1 nucleoside recognition domain-containing protein [Bacillus pseudomycoides]MED4652870.1 nucleoside recognition domain-containing protein [Bacillus pseudomycoides]PDX98293.1 ferrous iron transporter B [Bacillus pseudomycoides]PEE04386.1 ferrous iron transporter B [Bacillus pseudomycoides]
MKSHSASKALPLDYIVQHAQTLTKDDIRDDIVGDIYRTSASICKEAVQYTNTDKLYRSERLDKIFTSPIFGFPIMLGILSIIFYLTIAGANVPSDMIAEFFGWAEGHLTAWFQAMNAPNWVHGILILGLFRGTGAVISVMLPPMAIFFPMFALLENYGYLPRVAFNMDRLFKRSGAHGKQSLTMAMGFGCNAAAIMSTRIIESPRERMLAILTNNFVPCNGRWPTLILMASLFMAAGYTGSMQTLVTAGVVVGMVIIGVIVTLTVSWVLSKTALKGVPTHYTLELPPYRKPKIWNTIVRSTLDKSLYVLKRAVIVAAPAAMLTWVLANIYVGDTSLLMYFVNFLDPFAKSLGLDGFILAAFILGLPANEIVIPILLMSYLSTGALTELDDLNQIKNLFLEHGWTWLTALNTMLFSLLHFPCGTTLVNIYKETKSPKWTFLSFAIPTVIAIVVTFLTSQLVHWLGLV